MLNFYRLFSMLLFIAAGAITPPLDARTVNVAVFADGYRYGPAGMELARALDDSVSCPGIRADFANTENILTPGSLNRYDVLVLFNHNNITRSHEKNVTNFVNAGGGLVALHHVINKANENPELTRLIGGYYDLADGLVEHRDFNVVKIQGVSHPVLEGLPERFKVYDDQDFKLKLNQGQEIVRLLTCDITDNGPQDDCGWTRTEGAGRIIYLSPGDPVAKHPFVRNESLFKLIVNSIRWAAGD